MRPVDIKVPKSKLSKCARLAARADAGLTEAVQRAYLTAPLRAPDPMPPPSRPVAPLADLLRELADDRQDR